MRIGRLAYDALAMPRSGYVLFASRRAATLTLDGDTFLTLLPANTPLHPWGCAVCWEMVALQIQMPVLCDGLRLSVGDTVFVLDQAEIAELTISTRPAHPVSDALRTTLRVMLGQQPIATVSNQPAAAARIGDATEALVSHGNPMSLAGLTGLGAGLTPAADDVIVGALAGLDFAGSYAPTMCDVRKRLVAALPPTLELHTPRLSAQMLRAATAGRYPEAVCDLASAASASTDTLEVAAAASDRLLALGHSSGREMLRGFSAALDLAALQTPGSHHRHTHEKAVTPPNRRGIE